MLKNIFLDVKNKFETALGILKKEEITIAPEDPAAAVSQYAKVMKTIIEKPDLFTESQRIKYTIDTRTKDIPDARTYLLTLKEIRIMSQVLSYFLPYLRFCYVAIRAQIPTFMFMWMHHFPLHYT
ncbi:hypothetical protein K2173_014719 [Erythroxylum novogranatense]|uniref:Uncharacterized protein n=1 Tax=Erythroxylum novogranatense TaxID=1862640 RepID=A0AAV8TFF1_9ROSI|nr:hypothetical protein K2173_014719 [Erythroxylum novogranatense]